MCPKRVLAIDAGTSGVRCLIADLGGHLISLCRREWSYQPTNNAPHLGREFDPGAFWRIICECIREALSKSGIDAQDIGGVSATSQREGIVLLDESGEELYAGPNIDLRALTEGMRIDSEHGAEVYDITGHRPSFLFAPAKLKWFQNSFPRLYPKIATVLTISDWIIYRLSGERTGELCGAGEIGLADIRGRTRSNRLIELLDLPRDIYPELVPAGSRVGTITLQAATDTGLGEGTPVAQGAPDTHCGLIGMGVREKGQVGALLGWSAPVQMIMGAPVFDPGGRIWTGCHIPDNLWILESTTGEAGNSFHWLRETMFGCDGTSGEKTYDTMDKLALSVTPGADGVLAFVGADIMDMRCLSLACGGFLFPVPLSATNTKKAHLVRAVLENISFAVKANCSQLEAVSSQRIEELRLGGGLTKSRCLNQILPAVLNRPVMVAGVPEVSGLGAAMCAAVGAGFYASIDEAGDRMKPEMAVIEPESLAALEYADYYQSWLSMRKWLKEKGEERSE